MGKDPRTDYPAVEPLSIDELRQAFELVIGKVMTSWKTGRATFFSLFTTTVTGNRFTSASGRQSVAAASGGAVGRATFSAQVPTRVTVVEVWNFDTSNPLYLSTEGADEGGIMGTPVYIPADGYYEMDLSLPAGTLFVLSNPAASAIDYQIKVSGF